MQSKVQPRRAVVISRPPGHHNGCNELLEAIQKNAWRFAAHGGCILNETAIAVRNLLARHPESKDGTAWQFYEVGADFLFHSGYDRDQPKGNRSQQNSCALSFAGEAPELHEKQMEAVDSILEKFRQRELEVTKVCLRGVPGSGKTLVAAKVISEACQFLDCKAALFISPLKELTSQTGRNLRVFFEEPVKVEVFVSKLRCPAAIMMAVAVALQSSIGLNRRPRFSCECWSDGAHTHKLTHAHPHQALAFGFAMWHVLVSWATCQRRRPVQFPALQPVSPLPKATTPQPLPESLLQDLVEWLDWENMRELVQASAATRRLVQSEASLALIASRRGLLEEPCLVRRSLQSLAVADRLRGVTPSVYFERASTSLQEDSYTNACRLADVLRRHHIHLVLFVSGHCGRNAPESIKSSFTKGRATEACEVIADLLFPDSSMPEMFVCGCGSSVAARDIAVGGETDWSKADLRAELRAEDGSLLVDWGRKWWEPFQGAPGLPLPEWQPFPRRS
ncbi:unnamed protein product [Symbiodinium sp. KB8]|nr:unnamed protein product [Symbiodinium sp. KB8]